MTTSESDSQAAFIRLFPPIAAGLVVFLTSAVVLVLEILGSRLLAPYIGVTLQTYTAIIGTVLTGISIGTWVGGSIADRVDPKRLIGPILTLGGIFVLITVPMARWAGESVSGQDFLPTVQLAFLTLFFPAAVLSAVNPTMVKIRLSSLQSTGRTVGRLSALATAGAIAGTFVTGFLLVATFRVSLMLLVAGVVLTTIGVCVLAVIETFNQRTLATLVVLVLVGSTAATATRVTSNPCDIESSYYCVKILQVADMPHARILKLDDLQHSFQDLSNPKFLGFPYVQVIGSALDNLYPPTVPISVLSVGAGAFTLPRYVQAVRPGSHNDVLEVDPALVKIDKEQMALRLSPDLQVHIGDARMSIPRMRSNRYDVVIGDAFGSKSVPWQLSTTQFLDQVDRVLRDNGTYVQNVVDYAPFLFVRAELATLKTVFPYVVLVGFGNGPINGGNLEILASKRPVDAVSVSSWLPAERGYVVLDGNALEAFIGNQRVLTDDFAPVDQLLAD